MAQTILIVDDQEINRKLLGVIFQEQYNVLEAENGQVALEILQEEDNDVTCVFLDLMMPIKSGLDVLEYMRENKLLDKIPVIMVTGEATAQSDEKAYEYGVADIIYKPFEERVVMRRTKNIIELYEHRNNLEKKLEERTRELKKSQATLAKNNEFLINALSSVVEFRNLESGEHVKRVKQFTNILAHCVMELYPKYGLTEEKINLIADASALHDIGKIAIPDNILLKPGKLTKEEYEEMKKHTIYGCEILERFKLENSDFYNYCYDICRYHHERNDGKGYPDKLKGHEIPISAQIVSIADVYDALVSPRIYKMPYDVYEASRMILEGECGNFSDELLDAFKMARDDFYAVTELEG